MKDEHKYERRIGKYLGPDPDFKTFEDRVSEQMDLANCRLIKHLPVLSTTIERWNEQVHDYITLERDEDAAEVLGELLESLYDHGMYNSEKTGEGLIRRLDDARESHNFDMIIKELEAKGN
jgi:hypothetical protein